MLVCETSFCCCFERTKREDGVVHATSIGVNKNSFQISEGGAAGTYVGNATGVAWVHGSNFHEMVPPKDKPLIDEFEDDHPDFLPPDDKMHKFKQYFYNHIQTALRTPGALTEEWSECFEGDLVIC